MSTQLRFIDPEHQHALNRFFTDKNFINEMTLNLEDMTLTHRNEVIDCHILPSRTVFEYYLNDSVHKVALLLEKFRLIEAQHDIYNKDIFTRYKFKSPEKQRVLKIKKTSKSKPTIYQAFLGSFMPQVCHE